MPKVFIVYGGDSYARMFTQLGWEVVEYLESADMVQFCGGADVSPDLHGEHQHPATFSDRRRDLYEAEIYQKALAKALPMAGICRGGQLLNVLNGGGLYQHVTGHAVRGTHAVFSSILEGSVQVTSTHHQMMIAGDGGFLEAWADNLSPTKERCPNGFIIQEENPVEPEVIFYEDTYSLCFQPHPEFFGAEECRAYYFRCLETYLGGRIPYSSDK